MVPVDESKPSLDQWMKAGQTAGPAIILSYAVSGLSALLSVLCYTEFAIEIPIAGGSFSYLRVELGDFVAFIAAANILLESIVVLRVSLGLGPPILLV